MFRFRLAVIFKNSLKINEIYVHPCTWIFVDWVRLSEFSKLVQNRSLGTPEKL